MTRRSAPQEVADIAEAKRTGKAYRPRLKIPQREHMEALAEEMVMAMEMATGLELALGLALTEADAVAMAMGGLR